MSNPGRAKHYADFYGQASERAGQDDAAPGDLPLVVVIGNCQAGWQILMAAAVWPELFGPIILAGAPVSAIGVGPGRDEIIQRHPLLDERES